MPQREIRTPAIGLRIRNILKDFPPVSMEEAHKLFNTVCVRADVVGKSSKTSTAFRSSIGHMESWADGWVKGRSDSGCEEEIIIVSGPFRVGTDEWSSGWPVSARPRWPKTPSCIAIFCVKDLDKFWVELREFVQVAAVQNS